MINETGWINPEINHISMMKEARLNVSPTYNGEKTLSSDRGPRKLDSYVQRMKLEYSITPYTNVNANWIKPK